VKPPSILIIDDEPLMRLSIMDALKAVGYEVRAAASGHEGMALLTKETYDVVITDLRLPGADGLSLLQACKQRSPRTEVIVITAHGSVDSAVEAMKLGAYDYITKPFSMDELLLIVERLSKVLALRQENLSLREELEGKFTFQGILGKNEQMRQVLQTVKALAAADGPVLIIGEVGTGKELVANTIHRNSGRRDHALIKVSCRGLSEDTLVAELFGHEKGAFTGAVRQRRGRFELAHKGTLFLDDIGDLPAGVQARLLKVLKDRRFERMGGREPLQVDVRVVCATTKPLSEEVQAGRFRNDLSEMLKGSTVTLPPLRTRREDILVIAEHLLRAWAERKGKAFKGFSESAQKLLLRYSYPGNVRELEHMVERAVALGRATEEVQASDLCGFASCPLLGGTVQQSCGFCREGLSVHESVAPAESLSAARDEFERQYIVGVLERVRGNRREAARLLGVSEKTLSEKCRRYGLPASEDPGSD
jgi:two-component system response regulator AtoC